MKKAIKYLLYQVFYRWLLFFSFDRFLRKLSRHHRLIIYFHGVGSSQPFQINGRHLPQKDFEQLLHYFKNNFDVVTLEEICGHEPPRSASSRKKIALTFDDGFDNNRRIALPLLERYSLPATFFISTLSLDDPDYIHPCDRVDLVKVKLKESGLELNGEEFVKGSAELVSRKSGQSVYQFLCGLTPEELDRAVKGISRRFSRGSLTADVNEEAYKLITRDTLPDLLRYPLAAVGSHGHHHLNLTCLNEHEMQEQLILSKALLEKESSREVKSIAFPYGEFNEAVVAQSEEAGYQYLLAGGDVESKFCSRVFPRIGVATSPGVYATILSINRGFGRFGF